MTTSTTQVVSPQPQVPPARGRTREPSGGRMVALWKAVVVGSVAAVVVALAAVALTAVVANGRADELDKTVGALDTQVTALQAQVTSLAAQNSALTGQVSVLQGQVNTLTMQNSALRAELGTAMVVPTVTYGAALEQTGLFAGSQAYLLVLDVTVHNPSGTDAAQFSTFDFRLKGPDQTVYPLLESSAVAGQPRFARGVEGLPGGRVQIQGQQLAAGETVRGSLVFYVTKPVTTFTVVYHGTTRTVRV